MSKHEPRVMVDEKGNAVVFNHEAFEKRDRELRWAGNPGKSQRLTRKKIAEATNKSQDTVKKWCRGESAPGELETIRKLENLYGVEPDTFLKRCDEKIEEKKVIVMKRITEREMDAARKLYETMCEAISAEEYVDPVFLKAVQEKCGIEPGQSRYHRRNAYCLAVRKAGFDIPDEIRDRLLDMVDKLYGPSIDDPDGYFLADDYLEYCKRNGFKDTGEVRTMYSSIFVADRYLELDEIFEPYRKRGNDHEV